MTQAITGGREVMTEAQMRKREERELPKAELARREAQAREAQEGDEAKRLVKRRAALPGKHGPFEELKEFEFIN